MTIDKLTLTGGGPIEGSFEVDLTDGPGLREFRGDKASGKTTMLNSISLLSGQKVTITLNDRAKSGQVEGFGVCHPLTKKRRKGEPEVNFLDSQRCDLDELIDPDGKTPVTRDNKRIKALAVLTGVELLANDFREALGDDAFSDLDVKASTDPVLYATRVKSACDAKARELETRIGDLVSEANFQHTNAAELSKKLPNGDPIETDEGKLTAAYEAATIALAAMETKQQTAAKQRHEIIKLQESVVKSEQEYDGVSVDAAEESLIAAKTLEDTAAQLMEAKRLKVVEAEEALSKATREFESAQRRREAATEAKVTARKHAEFVDAVHGQISELKTIDDVSPDDIEKAQAAKTAAASAVFLGQVKRRLDECHKTRDELLASVKAMRESAELWQERGQSATDLLVDKLDLKKIDVKFVDGNPRLMVDTERGPTYLDQDDGLSGGERVATILEEVLPHLPKPGCFAIPQPIYQELSPDDRVALSKLCTARGIYGWGGIISEGELRTVFVK